MTTDPNNPNKIPNDMLDHHIDELSRMRNLPSLSERDKRDLENVTERIIAALRYYDREGDRYRHAMVEVQWRADEFAKSALCLLSTDMAQHGLLRESGESGKSVPELTAKVAFSIADAMLAERTKRTKLLLEDIAAENAADRAAMDRGAP